MPRADARRRADELLERFDLANASRRLVRTYSGGMRRRIDIAASILKTPDVLFLDEPTTGLDPRSRNQVWDIVRIIVAQGTTVLLTTQYLDEADQLASRIAVIDHGKVIATGTPDELKAKTGSQCLNVRPAESSDLPTVATVVGELTHSTPDIENGLVTAPVVEPEVLPAVVRRLDDAGIVITELALRSASLNEVFLSLTGHPAEEHDESETETAEEVAR
jgi:oleandomycin transport system ATP-binding protein